MASMEEYVSARAAYLAAAEEIKNYADILSEVGRELGKEGSLLTFANTGVGLPMEYMAGPSLAAEKLPSAKAIMQAIANKAEAKSVMDNAWYSLSEAAKSALQPPPR